MSQTNRTSSIRSGFAYQDFWSLKLCGGWLASPDKYKWIQFETSADSENLNKFYLDDIVCLDSSDFYEFYQIKHRQDSTNKWTWDDLLNPERVRGTSLMKKWTGSLDSRVDKTKCAIFITNGEGDDEILKFLKNEILDIKAVRTEAPALYDRILKEIGNSKNFEQIFQRLHFRFKQENLAEGALETSIRKFFYEKLKATEPGVSNLYLEIQRECRNQHTQRIDIETLRAWCEFDAPRPLEENFDIPPDFEFFDNATHETILSDLQKRDGGIKVIFGKPGVGKSVYLSKVDEELRKRDLISIKHHYHISPEDSNPHERLNAERVIEAVKSQLKTHTDVLGHLANQNSKEIPIEDFIAEIAKNLSKQGKAIVMIIDGLDHVLRYGDKEDLESFLKEICVPQQGVWIVIGMQMIAKSHLPQVVFDRCPESTWIEIKGLSKEGATNLIKLNATALSLPDDARQFSELTEKLYSITGGNPLHLRYSLHQLKKISGNNLITDYSCKDLIPYGAGIEKYYDALWRQVSAKAKEILLTVSSVNFLFSERQLIECICSFTTNPADVTAGFSEISHLVSTSIRNQVSVYHNSFELFLRAQPEMSQQKIVIKRNVKNWLERSDYDYLKWAELRIIEHELGNSGPLLEIGRDWLIDAICFPCNPDHISKQMTLAGRVACEKDDFAKALQISYLHTYYLNSRNFVEEAAELIWEEAIQEPRVFDYMDVSAIPTKSLPALASIADSCGNHEAAEEIQSILIERLSTQEYRPKSIPGAPAALLEVLPYNRGQDVEKVYKYIIQFRSLKIAESLLELYSRKLLTLDQEDKVTTLLKLGLTETEKAGVQKEFAKYGFEHKSKNLSVYFKVENDLPIICLLYRIIKGDKPDPPELPKNDLFSSEIKEHDSDARIKWQELYYEYFFIGSIYGVLGKQDTLEKWISELPELWAAKAMGYILQAGLKLSAGILNGSVDYAEIFSVWKDFQPLKWPEDRKVLGFQQAFSDAIYNVLEDTIGIRNYVSSHHEITLNEYSIIGQNPAFFRKDSFLSIVLKSRRRIATREVYEKIVDDDIGQLAETVSSFPDRALAYARISKLARIYGETEFSQVCLKNAAKNMLGYGNHKDIYLFDVMDAVESCARSGVKKEIIDGWIRRLVPLIDCVGDYTDGDETSHLPNELADLLASQDRGLLRKYYYQMAGQEDLFFAEDLFKYVIKSLPFAGDQEVALACTAIDKDSFLQLKSLAQSSAGALNALNNIQSYLGEVNFKPKKQSSYEPSEKKLEDYSSISPEQLAVYLTTNAKNKWDWNKYLSGWLSFWRNRVEKETIYNAIKPLVYKFGIQGASGDLLDAFYPLAYEFDSGVAFEMLCAAQDRGFGWQRYWADKKEAERRWQFVKDKYPRRYLEFFKKSSDYHVPLSRGVKFLTIFDDLPRAQAMTEASVCFAESLMADMLIPVPSWLESQKEIRPLDILFQRLLWPSPIVQERAASALGQLLSLKAEREAVYVGLLDWISQQSLESAVAIGILPVLKYLSVAATDERRWLNIEALAKVIPLNSIVIEKLFDEVSFLTGKKKPFLPPHPSIDPVSDDYVPNAFFSKYCRTFIAPIYMDRAKEIERQSLKPFVSLWFFTAERLATQNAIQLNTRQLDYHANNEHGDHLLGFSSKISQVYRSAFLRVLHYFYLNGDIPGDFYLDYSYSTLPIELSKWKIRPTRAPAWWPQLDGTKASESDGHRSVHSISFKIQPASLARTIDGNAIVGAQGAIKPLTGWVEASNHSFTLLAFGYKVLGPNLPEPDEVFTRLAYGPGLIIEPSKTERPFNFLDEQKHYEPVNEKAFVFKDLIIYPIVARDHDLCIALWQFFRDYDSPFTLNWQFVRGAKFVSQLDKWILEDKRGKPIAVYTDWLEGLKERYGWDMPINHGQSLQINSQFLNQWLETEKLRLGYVLETTYRSKESFEKAKVYHDSKLINVGNIII